MIVRAYWQQLGGHTHVAIFATMSTPAALGKCGDLTFRNEEWQIIAPDLSRLGWQVIPTGRSAFVLVQSGGGQTGIRCLLCGRTSWSRHDVEHRYCGNCHIFHEG